MFSLTKYRKRIGTFCLVLSSFSVDLQGSGQSLYTVLRERLFEGETSLRQTLYNLRGSVLHSGETEVENQLALWLEASFTGASSPWGVFSQLGHLKEALDFWEQHAPHLEMVLLPKLSEILTLVGTVSHPSPTSLWGYVQALQQLTGDPGRFVTLLGTPTDTSGGSLYGILSQISNKMLNEPLKAMLSLQRENSCDIESLLVSMEAAVQKVCPPDDPNLGTTEQIILRRMGSSTKEQPVYPESFLALTHNLFRIVVNAPFLSFETFRTCYQACLSPSEGEEENFYQTVANFVVQMEGSPLDAAHLKDVFSASGSSPLYASLTSLREAVALAPLLWIGERGEACSAASLQGQMSLLFETWRKCKWEPDIPLEESMTRLERRLMDIATMLKSPLVLDPTPAFRVLYATLPEQLNDLLWRIQYDASMSTRDFLRVVVGVGEDTLSEGTMMGNLNYAMSSLQSLPLARFFGEWPPAASSERPPYETLSSVMARIMETVYTAETSEVTTLLRKEIFGEVEGSTHETLAYNLNLLESSLRTGCFSIADLPTLFSFAALSSDHVDSWRDRLDELRPQLHGDLCENDGRDLRAFFPDTSWVLDDEGEETWTHALWCRLKEAFPSYWAATIGVSSETRPSLRVGTSLASHLVFWLNDAKVKSLLGRSLSASESDDLLQCQQWLQFIASRGAGVFSASSRQMFSFYEKIGAIYRPATQTIWGDLYSWERAVMIGESASREKSQTLLQRLRGLGVEAQTPLHKILNYITFWQDYIDLLVRNVSESEIHSWSQNQDAALTTQVSNVVVNLGTFLQALTPTGNTSLEEAFQCLGQNLDRLLEIFSWESPKESTSVVPSDNINQSPERLLGLADSLLQLATVVSLKLPDSPVGSLAHLSAFLERCSLLLQEVPCESGVIQAFEGNRALLKGAFTNLADAFTMLAAVVETA